MVITTNSNGIKVAELYWQDLTPECQKALFDEMGENGNFVVFPFAEIILEEVS